MDLRKLKTLLDLFENSNLVEMEFSEGEERVRMSRAAPPQAPAARATPSAAAATPALVTEKADGAYVKSPMVGTFYRAAAPDRPPFVRIGQQVNIGDTICIIEAMKLMNEIPAPCAGVVKEILVENSAGVAYGEKLFVIE